MGKLETIEFTTDENDTVEFFVLEQTMLNGVNYLLVSDSDEEDDDDDDACVLIMREEKTDDEYSVYEIVEDDTELKAISKIFEELMEDVNIMIE